MTVLCTRQSLAYTHATDLRLKRPTSRRLALGGGGGYHLDISAAASCSASFGCTLLVGRSKQKLIPASPA